MVILSNITYNIIVCTHYYLFIQIIFVFEFNINNVLNRLKCLSIFGYSSFLSPCAIICV